MDKRVIGGVLALTGALLLAVATFSHGWFSVREGHFGLTSYERCDDGECKVKSYAGDDGMPRRLKPFVMYGRVTYWLALGAVAMLVVSGLLALANKPIHAGLSFSPIAVGLSSFTLSFALLFMINKPPSMTMGYGVLLALLGTAAGAGGGVAIKLWERDADGGGPPGPGPMALHTPGPPCPRCALPARWIGQYARWFCERCRTYL